MDLFEDARITRIKGTYASSRLDAITHRNVVAVGVSDNPVIFDGPHNTHDNTANTANTATGLLIEYKTITRVWTPEIKGGLINLRAAHLTLGRIGALCHCRLEESDTMNVVIRGDNEEDIEQAISKLKVTDTAARELLTFPHIYSFPVLEGELSIALQLTALKDLNDRRVHTTLQSQSINLRNALVVSMVQGGNLVPVKTSSPQNPTSECLLWNDFPHMPFGIEMNSEAENLTSSTSTVLDHASAEKFATRTGRWVQQNPSEFEDPSQSSPMVKEESIFDDEKQPAATGTYKSPLESTSPAKPLTKRMRAVKGSLKPKPQTIAPTEDSQGSQVISGVEVPSSEEVTVTTGPGTVTKQNQQLVQLLQPTEIEELYFTATPPHQNTPSELGTSSAPDRSTEWEIVHGGRDGRLIHIDDRPQDPGMDFVNDRLQDPSPSRKKLRNTMGQRKPQRPLASTATIVKSSEDAAKQILSLARPRQGPITFELGIGRLLVHSQTGPGEFKKAFAVAEWPSAFPKKNGVNAIATETTFTPRLTRLSIDVETILNLRLSQGRRLFVKEAHDRRVTYIISCTTRTNEQVVIEVNQNGSFKVRFLSKFDDRVPS